MTLWSWLLLPWSLLCMLLCVPVRLCCRGRLERWRWRWRATFCSECLWGGPLGWAVIENSLFVCPRCRREEV